METTTKIWIMLAFGTFACALLLICKAAEAFAFRIGG